MNVLKWIESLKSSPVKKAMPILSFPSVQLLGVSVTDLISSSDLQARGMKAVADRTAAAAAVSMMDLSVEAEAFGSSVRFFGDEVPTVVGRIVETSAQADSLPVPRVGAGRTGLYVEAISKARGMINDRPVFAGVIGPFSLTGRLLDVSQAMLCCYDEPDMVHAVLAKAAAFLTEYIAAYREAGADGVVIAEPLAGLLTPAMNYEFSAAYVRQIISAARTDDFAVIYHNCGGGTVKMVGEILSVGADAYHFGNAIDMLEMLRLVPSDTVVMGNIDPAGQFRNGTPQSIREATLGLLERCGAYPNFVISSGCDVPPASGWNNIDAFFKAVGDFYAGTA